MLLFKVRDQIKMTLGSYKILHQGSILFGQQRTGEALENYRESEARVETLQIRKK